MKMHLYTVLCASLMVAVSAQASDLTTVRPSMEVAPGVTVSADDISTNYTDVGTGDLTFLGNVSIDDGTAVKHVPWATFSQKDLTLSAGTEHEERALRMEEYCLDGAYWLGGKIWAYPTRSNPYRRPISPPALLYCEGNFLRFL